MKVDYSIAFKIDGVWSPFFYFKRDIYLSDSLDEVLDTGIVVSVPSAYKDIERFTLCRIRATNHANNAKLYTLYYWTGQVDTDAVTTFAEANETSLNSFLSRQTFTHKIQLIELTKILELAPCDSLSFTHRLRETYFPYADYVSCEKLAFIYDTEAQEITESLSPSLFSYHSNEVDTLYASPSARAYFQPSFIPIYRTDDERDPTMYLQVVDPNGNYAFGGNSLFGEEIRGESGYPHGTFDGYRSHQQEYNSDFGKKVYDTNGNVISVPFNYEGTYKVIYTYTSTGGISLNDYVIQLGFDVELKNVAANPKTQPSITDVINRILSVGQGRPLYKDQKYRLDGMNLDGTIQAGSLADKLDKISAPEFWMPRMTTFEALLEVGKKIHGIPRLKVDDENSENADPVIITYDMLGGDEQYTFPAGSYIIGYHKNKALDDYCGGLDNYAENVVNTVDPDAGTVTEPFDGGWKTLRCDSGVQIDNKSAVFEVSRPIYRIVKFEMAYTDGEPLNIIGDITKYVYEQAEYEGLFVSDTATFPNSVAHALVYKQGDRFIRGFNTTSSALLNLIQNFEKPSIKNICEDEGKNFGTNLYGNLAFRITYIPMDNIRIRQYKPYKTHPNGLLLYNQQNANTVESSYYGENLKGKIARMGNPGEVWTVRFSSPENLPTMGQILTDEDGNERGYIYKITRRNGRDFTVCDIYVSPDFNRLSEYFSLESNFRLFEVSERQSIDRPIMVSRIIDISFEPKEYTAPRMIGGGKRPGDRKDIAFKRFIGTFIAGKTGWDSFVGSNNTKRANVAVVKLITDNKNGHNYDMIGESCYCFPVNSSAFGNALVFSFGFADSYSAGNRSTAAPGYQWKQKKATPYGNNFGEFWGMEFGIAPGVYVSTGYGGNTGDKITLTYADQTAAGGFEDSLPMLDKAKFEYTMDNSFFSTYSLEHTMEQLVSVRIVDKNSSEHIKVTVQFSGQCSEPKIVMGSAMWNNNLLIRDDPVKDGNGTIRTPHVYGIKRTATNSGRLNSLRNVIDINAANVFDLGTIQQPFAGTFTGYLDSITLSTTEDFVSWCIADSVTGDLYIGVNEAVKANGATSRIYFNFDEEA